MHIFIIEQYFLQCMWHYCYPGGQAYLACASPAQCLADKRTIMNWLNGRVDRAENWELPWKCRYVGL